MMRRADAPKAALKLRALVAAAFSTSVPVPAVSVDCLALKAGIGMAISP
jgi:hypothetical protein